MNLVMKYFLRGLVIVVPIAITVYVLYAAFTWIDRLVGAPVPGVGFAVTVASVILIGVLASNIVGKTLFGLTERLFARAPFVKIVYTSVRDLVEAFVGDKKRFSRPVIVSISADGAIKTVGFVTREEVDFLGLTGHSAVYFPHSYNFSGQLALVPRERITPIALDSGQVMPFVVSGGVSGELTQRSVTTS